LFSRNRKSFNDDYPVLIGSLKSLKTKSFTIDGEITALDENGADLFISFDCKGPVVKLHFVDPVSGRKISDREGHHGLDKRKDVCSHTSKLLLYPKNRVPRRLGNS
jgi:hypothetical protein